MDVNARLWREFREFPGRLRIGLLLNEHSRPVWVDHVISTMQGIPEFEFDSCFLLPPPPSGLTVHPSTLFRLLRAWSSKSAPDWFGPTSTPNRIRAAQTVECAPDGSFSPVSREAIAARQLDVLVALTAEQPAGNCDGLARLGVWTFGFGEPEFAGVNPPFWGEVYSGSRVCRLSLRRHTTDFERGRVIGEVTAPATASARYTTSQASIMEAAAGVLVRGLLDALCGVDSTGPETTFARPARLRLPGNLETARHATRCVLANANLRRERRGKGMIWTIGVRPAEARLDFSNPRAGSPYREVPMPDDRCYADPFLVEHDSRQWLFFEDIDRVTGLGSLSVMPMLSDGGFGDPVPILAQPHHISYPHVFRDGGEVFMIPETGEGANVQLYRAKRFPFEWTLESVLVEGIELVDTTPFQLDGTWYFFTTSMRNSMETYLFTAPRLDGRWQYHPANPICTDVRQSRGAGALFRSGQSLIRPAQDCSNGYGYALAFKEITRLTPSEYAERLAGTWLPNWAPGLSGAHTFNRNDSFEVVDGYRWMPVPGLSPRQPQIKPRERHVDVVTVT